MKKDQLRQIIKEEIQKILKEDIDIASELNNFFQENPFTKENQWSHHVDAFKHIESKIGRPLIPQEKSKTTRTISKFRKDFWGRKFKEESEAEDKAERDRYRNNLLPLTTDNGNGRPDGTYYELASTYSSVDRDGNVRISHSDPKSGYTDYRLRDKWITTPVDKATLDRYWPENRLRYIGWYSQEEK
jgi:hypothetical protein